ncbi:Protein kinase-like domain [Cordyceps militaris CM01]|uniref:Protein kinase-like domain n=1 Tax=Cordyceps militaris (strain CM01) TaxID=983644 RepID=G3JGM7_CORMM|nr:Protein kinase-like domain [Cordyceps militaris CM01]EGX93296.1 Protein kinase-like domain [Cordyceps militaris CM01]
MTTRNLLSGPITLSDAKGRSSNVLHALLYPQRKLAFYNYIEEHRVLLEEVIAHHLGAKPTNIQLSPQEWWRHGSFNLCVPFTIHVDPAKPNLPEHAFIRFPLPYRVGELIHPGNSDEKLSCEAAMYAWLEENCPSVPIPKLYGFGLSTNQRFTNVNLLPWWSRWFHEARRIFLATLGLQTPSQYARHASTRFAALDIGYLLIEMIPFQRGAILSETWQEKRDDARLQNLQRDLARVMVSLSRVRLPRIGTFRLDNDGYLRLDNRPITVDSTMHENDGLSPTISRRTTFSSVRDFILSQLAIFETRFLEQPNSALDEFEAWPQMGSLAIAKLALPQLYRDDLCNGPFVCCLTDLHQSNIFVDEDWNITCIIDLEFACSWPAEFVQTPYWLDAKFLNDINPTDFAARHVEFTAHIRHEEEAQQPRDLGTEPLSSIMQRSWDSGMVWVPLALKHPATFTQIFEKHILKSCFDYPVDELDNGAYMRFCSRIFRRNSRQLIDRKLDDGARYMKRLTEAFTDAAES